MENLVTWPLHWSEAKSDLPLTLKNGGVGEGTGKLCRSTNPLTVHHSDSEQVFFSVECFSPLFYALRKSFSKKRAYFLYNLACLNRNPTT